MTLRQYLKTMEAGSYSRYRTIEIGADISFDRTTDAQISGFICHMDSTGDLAGGGGQGKTIYDIRYKRNLINF